MHQKLRIQSVGTQVLPMVGPLGTSAELMDLFTFVQQWNNFWRLGPVWDFNFKAHVHNPKEACIKVVDA